MYDSFINDPSIDKLQSESFSSKNASEKAKLLKQVDKTVFDTTQQLNRLTTGTSPTEQFVEKDYFATDVAYLPSELISVETLVDANTKAKLNWRDFYNLEEFVKDRKNILQDGATEFYAYSKFVNDQKTELSKKNAHLGADFDYATISNKRETLKKDLEKINAEIAKFDNKVEAIKKLKWLHIMRIKTYSLKILAYYTQKCWILKPTKRTLMSFEALMLMLFWNT